MCDCCAHRASLFPMRCKNLNFGFDITIALFSVVGKLPAIRSVFFSSGLRYDLLCLEASRLYLERVCRHHMSCCMKIAPEHIDENVVKLIEKSGSGSCGSFLRQFSRVVQEIGEEQCPVSYLSLQPAADPLDAARAEGRRS